MPLFEHVPAQQPAAIPCPLAFVGEAPGETEVCRGIPLCGPSGRLFDKMLRLAGIERADCWVGNVFDFKLPDNKLKNICTPDKNSVPVPGCGFLAPDHHRQLDRLAAELAAAQPRVIVPLGGTALWAFTGRADITRSRGALAVTERILPGTPMLPTFHPAYVLHSYGALQTVVADLKKAAAAAQGHTGETPRELWLEPTLEDLHAFGGFLPQVDLLSVDIETAFGQITCIGFATDCRRAICVPFVDYRRPSRSYWEDASAELAAWQWVASVLSSPVPKLFQNGPYDVWWLTRAGFRVCNWREDTRLQQHARSPEEPKSLAYMASRWARIGPWKLMVAHNKEKRDDA